MNSLIELMAYIWLGQRVRKNLVRVQVNTLDYQPCLSFLEVLLEEGLILGYGEWDLDLESSRPVPMCVKTDLKDLFVVLKYNHGFPMIKKFDLRPILVEAAQLEGLQGTPDLFVLSTVLGIVSHREAFQKKIGGLLFCRVII